MRRRERWIGRANAFQWGLRRVLADVVGDLRPAQPTPVPIFGDEMPVLPKNRPLTVVVWNLQFAAGRSSTLFYEGGPRVHVDAAERDRTLAQIAEVLHQLNPDVVLLQEVDRSSDRTGRLDELAYLTRAFGPCAFASASYHHVPFVPVPWRDPMGKVDFHLAVLSRYRLNSATRLGLPRMDEARYRQAFNLRRAILDVRLALADGSEMSLLNTHLSAFSNGDGTLPKQVAICNAQITALERKNAPWVLAGDFNCLPPDDSPSRLPPVAAAEYADVDAPMAPLLERWASPMPLRAASDPKVWGTYVPFGSEFADRTIDWIFHGSRIETLEFRVHTGVGHVSDHLPLVWRMRLKKTES